VGARAVRLWSETRKRREMKGAGRGAQNYFQRRLRGSRLCGTVQWGGTGESTEIKSLGETGKMWRSLETTKRGVRKTTEQDTIVNCVLNQEPR